MERYERCYRDPASPLTPLTPLEQNPSFRFDFDVNLLLNNSANVDFSKNTAIQYSGTPLTSTTVLDSENPQKQRYLSKNLRNFFEPHEICPIKIIKTDIENLMSKHSTDNLENISQNLTPKMKKKSMGNVRRSSTNYYQGNYLELPAREIGRKRKSFSSLIYNTANVKNSIKAQTQNTYKESKRILKKSLKECSPISRKPLSPRTDMLLTTSGLSKYKSLFQREEINLMVVGMLTMKELEDLGIEDLEDRLRILDAAKYSENML